MRAAFFLLNPAILLLDEFDAVAKRRDDNAEIGELKRLVTVLVQAIDEWPSNSLLVAATNHPELLDPAVWRRFDRNVEFPLPTQGEITKSIEALIGSGQSDLHNTIDILSHLLVGVSFSDVSQHVVRARKDSLSRRRVFLLAPMRCGNQLEGAGNIEAVVAG